jgi:hypothetical protein
MERPQEITLAEMRSSGVRGVLIHCSDYRCSHSIEMVADQWAADVRPHPHWGKRSLGY